MIFIMNSKMFQDLYLVHERDKDILNTQYIIVSSRIRKRESVKNILYAYNSLYPPSEVMIKNTEEDKKEAYMDFLTKNNIGLLSSLVLLSLEKNFTIVFICTQNEWKLRHLQYIAEFIEDKFKYPVYNYKEYYKNFIKKDNEPIKVNEVKCRRKIKAWEKYFKNNQTAENMKTEKGRKLIMSDFKSKSKKKKRKILIERNLYYNGMDNSEMDEVFELFLR